MKRGGFVAPRRIADASQPATGTAKAEPPPSRDFSAIPAAATSDAPTRPCGSDAASQADTKAQPGPGTTGVAPKFRAPLASLGNRLPAAQPGGGSGAYGSAADYSMPVKRSLPTPAAPNPPGKVARPQGPTPASTSAPAAPNNGPASISEVYAVLYTKKELMQKKKASKKFQDGVITLLDDNTAILYDQDSKVVSKGRYKRFGGTEDGTFEMGTFHVEIDKPLTLEQFKSGSCFMSSASAPLPAAAVLRKPASQPFTPHAPAGGSAAPGASGSGAPVLGGRGAGGAASAPAALHDPHAANAVVLNTTQWAGGSGKLRNGRPVVPIVIDPYLCRHLRPHQEEGVRFLYEAVMGLRTPDKTGAILADEMGLGKTLQVITLAWTMLRQGPEGRPTASKVLVVTPATLVENWGKEVKKWLGSERLQALCLTQGPNAKQLIMEFKHGAHQRMMITSYETLRKYAGEMQGTFDLLVCDEGHRLKSVGGNKTIDALLSLGCNRRILLTGTPVQNCMQEFYALVSFVVPDALGSPAAFNRVYGIPITRAQEGTATAADKELGAARASELQAQVSAFILRRTQALLAKHLPPLTSVVLFCAGSEPQLALYGAVLRSKAVTSLLCGGGAGGEDNTLAVITALRKVANHPDLLVDPAGAGAGAEGGAPQVRASSASSVLPNFSQQFPPSGSYEASGKMHVLWVLLEAIAGRGERCVVVSTSTATLDLVERMVCRQQGLGTVRIDGGTSVDERQQVVDNFNKLGMGQVFLLSTRAGGAGLNLVGANHLVLYDSDWNPAMDQQAMARIWRDGQTKPCTVYRLLTTGTIEEKVYQRQLMKADLASATVAAGGGKAGSGKFSREELRALFSLNTRTRSDTRDLLPPGKVPGLVWIDPEELAGQQGGEGQGREGQGQVSPLVTAAACGLVTCINRMDGAAGEQGAAGTGAEVEGEEAEGDGQGGGAGEEGSGEEAGGGQLPDDADCLEVQDDE